MGKQRFIKALRKFRLLLRKKVRSHDITGVGMHLKVVDDLSLFGLLAPKSLSEWAEKSASVHCER